jgi:hypothetical protein
MFAILDALGMFVADLFKSRCRLEAENLLLRRQLIIALRRAPPRLRLRGSDRALLIWMTRLWPSLLSAVQVVQPDGRRMPCHLEPQQLSPAVTQNQERKQEIKGQRRHNAISMAAIASA